MLGLRNLNAQYTSNRRILADNTTGVRGDLIPSGSLLFDYLPIDKASHDYLFIINSYPVGGTLSTNPDGTFTLTGLPDGTYNIELDIFQDGEFLSTETYTYNQGIGPAVIASLSAQLQPTVSVRINFTGGSGTVTSAEFLDANSQTVALTINGQGAGFVDVTLPSLHTNLTLGTGVDYSAGSVRITQSVTGVSNSFATTPLPPPSYGYHSIIDAGLEADDSPRINDLFVEDGDKELFIFNVAGGSPIYNSDGSFSGVSNGDSLNRWVYDVSQLTWVGPVNYTFNVVDADVTAPTISSSTAYIYGLIPKSFLISVSFDEPVTTGADGWTGLIVSDGSSNHQLVFSSAVSTSQYLYSIASPGNISLYSPLTVTYTQPGDGIQDTSGNLLANGQVSVINLNDFLPNSFTLATINDVTPSTYIESSAATISGLSSDPIVTPAPPNSTFISIQNGEYRINGGAWTSVDGIISNGNTLQLRQLSAASANTTSVTTVDVGGFVTTFSTVTEQTDVVSPSFGTATLTYTSLLPTVLSISVQLDEECTAGADGLSGFQLIASDGTFVPSVVTFSGTSTAISLIISEDFDFAGPLTLAYTQPGDGIQDLSGNLLASTSFPVTSQGNDFTPNDFSLGLRQNIEVGSEIISDVVTVSGVSTALTVPLAQRDSTSISITNGEYRLNGGPWITTPGLVANGDDVEVRHFAPATFNTPTASSLTIGGVTRSLVSTTEVEDTTPDPIVITPQGAVQRSSTVIFPSFVVSGINSSSPISITNGEYSINGGITWVSSNGTLVDGTTVLVRHTSADAFGTSNTTQVTIGGVTALAVSTTASDPSIAGIQLLPDTPRNRVRLLIGDSSAEYISDEVLDYMLLTNSDNVNKTALQALDYIIAYAAKMKDETVDEVSVKWSQVWDHYRDLRNDFIKQASLSAAGFFWFGGTSKAENTKFYDNSDTVKSPIKVGFGSKVSEPYVGIDTPYIIRED